METNQYTIISQYTTILFRFVLLLWINCNNMHTFSYRHNNSILKSINYEIKIRRHDTMEISPSVAVHRRRPPSLSSACSVDVRRHRREAAGPASGCSHSRPLLQHPPEANQTVAQLRMPAATGPRRGGSPTVPRSPVPGSADAGHLLQAAAARPGRSVPRKAWSESPWRRALAPGREQGGGWRAVLGGGQQAAAA
jgi:hypothetical protein